MRICTRNAVHTGDVIGQGGLGGECFSARGTIVGANGLGFLAVGFLVFEIIGRKVILVGGCGVFIVEWG